MWLEFVDNVDHVLLHRATERHLDGGLLRLRHPGPVQQGRRDQGEPQHGQELLVLEPGTSAAASYFVPLAKWIVSKAGGWQVWAVERRENLLEDQSELNRYKEHKSTSKELFDYYLGYLKDPSITHHYQPVMNSTVEFAKQWGMNVAVQDLHLVIGDAPSSAARSCSVGTPSADPW